MPQNDVDHKHHRQRLKERFLQEGLDSFDPVNILELMLFYAIPQGDTNPTAHRLLDTFGSLSGVMNASVENLCQVKGVGQHAATLIKLFAAVVRPYLDDANRAAWCSSPPMRSAAICSPSLPGARWRPSIWSVWTDAAG